MKRRSFLQATPLIGAAGIPSPSAGNAHASSDSPTDPARMLRLKSDVYHHYPVDFSRGDKGARGFRGWEHDALEVTVPADETAIISMHVWNIDIDPSLPFTPDGPAGGVMEMLEWASRSAPIIRTEFPPILAAARKSGINVIHVASSPGYAEKYPGWYRAINDAGPMRPGLRHAPDGHRPEIDRTRLLFGPRYTEDIDYYSAHIDFPPQARPLDSEYVVVSAYELTEVCRLLGVWNLIYIGFAINWCLWFSPCGMTDMSRLGYRCNCIEEAVTAVENRESTDTEFNKRQSMWRTNLMFGWIHHSEDFISACERLGPPAG